MGTKVTITPSEGGHEYRVSLTISARELYSMVSIEEIKDHVNQMMAIYLKDHLTHEFVQGKLDQIVREVIRETVKEMVTAHVEERLEDFFGE